VASGDIATWLSVGIGCGLALGAGIGAQKDKASQDKQNS
jgi:hypothetical protein